MAAATQSIREIISSQPTAAAILQRFDIDVCSHANESLFEACAGLQLSVEQVLEKLEDGAARESGAEHADPTGFSPSRLIQHIVRIYHQNVRRDLPRLVEMAGAVVAKHGERAPELKLIKGLTEDLRTDLAEHIRKEEQVLFPYISEIDQAQQCGSGPSPACITLVGRPVFILAQEHEHAKLQLAEMRRLTDDFKPPVWACSTLVALYSGLRSFSAEFDEHIRLENDVLFPRAIEVEAERLNEGAR